MLNLAYPNSHLQPGVYILIFCPASFHFLALKCNYCHLYLFYHLHNILMPSTLALLWLYTINAYRIYHIQYGAIHYTYRDTVNLHILLIVFLCHGS